VWEIIGYSLQEPKELGLVDRIQVNTAMKITVKTLKGEKFPIEVEGSTTVEQVKGTIVSCHNRFAGVTCESCSYFVSSCFLQESTKAELSAANMRLIFSGKVLKDTDSLEACGIKENDFLVVMVTKPKKPAAAAPTAEAPAPAATAETPPTPAPAPAPAAESTTPAVAAAPADPPAAPARQSTGDFPPEVIANLTALGFPENEVRHCLRAAQGNPDVAVEFLTNGIPPGVGGDPPALGSSGGRPLEALRNHPQFNDLRRLVQSNPAMLQQVLTQIGQQQPVLLREINENQAAFLQMMNEPVAEDETRGGGSGGASSSGGDEMERVPDAAQMAQMMQNMDPGQLQMMATMMGMSPEQVQAVGRMIGQLPPEQLQEYMAQAMGAGGMAAGGGVGGPQVLRLSEEEMAAVDRLTEMGFDRAEAAQAFLACDKNEALAANLLMDGGFGFGGADDDNNDNNNNNGDNENGDDDEDMYS
jgi:UV excision repair protein RAD23